MNKIWGFRLVYKCLVVNRAGYKKYNVTKKKNFKAKLNGMINLSDIILVEK